MSTPNHPTHADAAETGTATAERADTQRHVTARLTTNMLAVQDRVAGIDPRVAERERAELRRKYGEA